MLNTAWTGRIQAIIVGLGLGLAFLMSINWWNIYAYHVPKCPHPNCVADFVAFYAQAQLIWDDRRSLYDLDKQLAYQNRIAPVEKVLPFVYPPITAALLAPLGWVPFSVAFVLMTVVNILLFLLSLRMLIRGLNLTPNQSHWLLLFFLCNFGVQVVIFYGQISALVLFLLTQHVLAQRQSKKISPGVWAGLLCVKPQLLFIPHFVLLLQRNWQNFLVAVLLVIILMGGSFGLIGTTAISDYFHVLRFMATENSWHNPLEGMHNLKALAGVWLPVPWNIYVWWGASGTVLIAVFRVNTQANLQNNGFEIRWITNSLALLLLSPHVFTHDLSLLVLPCALYLSQLKQAVPPGLGVVFILVAILPGVNYLFPTIMAITLSILFLLSLRLAKLRWTQR